MYSLFSFLKFLTIEIVHAGALNNTGDNNVAVESMWTTINGVFTLQMTPGAAVDFFASRIIAFSFSIMGALAVGLIMYAGIRLSLGGEEGVAEAKKIVQFTLIGLVLALIASSVIAFVIGIADGLLS